METKAAQRVAHPRAETGKTIEHKAGGKEILSGAMRVALAGERVNEGDVVGELRQVRDQVRDHLPCLTAWTKFILGPGEIAGRSLERHGGSAGKRLPIVLDQLRLVVPSLELTHGPGAENNDDVLGFRRKVRRPRRIGPARVNQGTRRGEQTIATQQTCQRDGTQRRSGIRQETAPIQQLSPMV